MQHEKSSSRFEFWKDPPAPGAYNITHCTGFFFHYPRGTAVWVPRLSIRACLHGGGGTQIGELIRLGEVICLSYSLLF